jgi:hypothetical protein
MIRACVSTGHEVARVLDGGSTCRSESRSSCTRTVPFSSGKHEPSMTVTWWLAGSRGSTQQRHALTLTQCCKSLYTISTWVAGAHACECCQFVAQKLRTRAAKLAYADCPAGDTI